MARRKTAAPRKANRFMGPPFRPASVGASPSWLLRPGHHPHSPSPGPRGQPKSDGFGFSDHVRESIAPE